MEYISPGERSILRVLATVTTLLCLTSPGLGSTYRHSESYGARMRHGTRHNKHQARHPERVHGFRGTLPTISRRRLRVNYN
ncbi:hypothetical protein PoB_000190900 [Plakobranchus ocellatus]|uniref:Secreted protein n=1 Tax=Plakobranchus ocellatus TaxID=259542 RepID=A0AAV3XX28_9GAST|nr:hypothetical protein PoB_000190900 [Plakobranchus ocellatus]